MYPTVRRWDVFKSRGTLWDGLAGAVGLDFFT
jgi:hypothetical protein